MIIQEELKRQLHYNPDTGIFTRIVSNSNRVKIKSIAGWYTSNGYIYIDINCTSYSSHRLAWLYMTGNWPEDQIDHINHVRDDNRWLNLRECTNAQNGANAGKPKNNTSGYKGVSWNKGVKKWTAQIMFNYKKIHLGCFTCKHEAAEAHNAKALELHGEFACLNEVAR